MQLPINKHIQLMQAYSPPIENRGNFNGLLLDFNEAVIPISQKVQEALINFGKLNRFQTYPEYGDFTKQIAKYAKCQEDQVLITNGSDQGIDLIFRTFTAKNDETIIPSPSFAMFYQSSELNQNTIIKPSYTKTGEFPLQEVLTSINEKTKLVVICNPNNPTGTSIPVETIETILKQASKFNAMVYVDEAYYEYSQITAVPLLEKYANLVITRTFSKAFGLASLRVGYVIAGAEIINEMKKVRSPYDINMVGKVAASAALEDYKSMERYRDEVVEQARPLVESFFLENKIDFLKSATNFILFKIPNTEDIFKKLEENGILLRPRNFNEEIFLRVSLGTLKQTKQFISVLQNLISTP